MIKSGCAYLTPSGKLEIRQLFLNRYLVVIEAEGMTLECDTVMFYGEELYRALI